MSFVMWGSALHLRPWLWGFQWIPVLSRQRSVLLCPECLNGSNIHVLMRPLGFNVCQRQWQAVFSLYKSQFVHKHTVYLRQYNLAGLIQSEPSQHFHTALYFSIYIILYFTLSFVKSFHVAFESISDDDAAQKAVYFFHFPFLFCLLLIHPQ